MSPVALRAVVGTKADLQDSREVSTEEALVSDLQDRPPPCACDEALLAP